MSTTKDRILIAWKCVMTYLSCEEVAMVVLAAQPSRKLQHEAARELHHRYVVGTYNTDFAFDCAKAIALCERKQRNFRACYYCEYYFPDKLFKYEGREVCRMCPPKDSMFFWIKGSKPVDTVKFLLQCYNHRITGTCILTQDLETFRQFDEIRNDHEVSVRNSTGIISDLQRYFEALIEAHHALRTNGFFVIVIMAQPSEFKYIDLMDNLLWKYRYEGQIIVIYHGPMMIEEQYSRIVSCWCHRIHRRMFNGMQRQPFKLTSINWKEIAETHDGPVFSRLAKVLGLFESINSQ